jgi:hypothetical protein
LIGDGLRAERAFAVTPTTGPDDAVQFGVLGPLQMRIGGALVPLGTPKQRAVLAVLIINASRPVGIDTLIGAAWGHRTGHGPHCMPISPTCAG